ncbi:MAG: 50S ribosomal protein L11 [Nitrospirae bacterium]|nr:MAG: 50S ribosomal protein L11 [Nitrospirota bacterium]
MAKKEVIAEVRLQIPAGQASPAPPVGPALGPHGINIMDFCNQFNEKTKDLGDTIIPVVLTIYADRSFTFITKTPPASEFIKKAAGIIKGSSTPGKEVVGRITMKQVEEIAKTKMPDLNTDDIEAAKRMIIGSAKSMGVEVVEE